jgi:type II secretory pathway component PulF
MLRRLTASAQGARIPAADLVALYRIYPALVFLMALVTGGVLIPITVWPKFEKILHDFHQPVPWSMRLLGGIAGQGTGSTGLAIVLILMGLLVLAPTSRYLAGLFFPTRLDPPFGGRVRDQLIWWTPVLRGDALDRGLADLCDFISDAADAGRPIDQALREASQTQTNAVMRSRTSNWAQAVEEGQPLHEAARAAGMPPLVVGMLATVRNTDDLAEVFSFLGRYYEFRFSRRRELLRALYIPLVVALMGGVVLLIALSIFQPMIALTMATARYAGGF